MSVAFEGLNEATDDPNIALEMSRRNFLGHRFDGVAGGDSYMYSFGYDWPSLRLF